ncbi:hypothetical protein GALL_380250 [mine drainage metagenome]|uniref:Peptidase S1A alpha-lytic prodomain domain-containing protein n=1 Tax=mine drainage metagenome TaxID=410659 RepID=A0A1J5QJW2_9ZZZZ
MARSLVVALVVTLTACGGLSSESSNKANATPSRTSEVGSGPATPVAGPFEALERDAALKFTTTRFAGVALVNNVLNIYLAGTDKDDPTTFEGHPIKHVRYSLVELEAAQKRISKVAKTLSSAGHTLFQWGVDVATNSVTISVHDPRADSVAVITLLGSGPYRFVAGHQASMT